MRIMRFCFLLFASISGVNAFSASYVKGHIQDPGSNYKNFSLSGWACQTGRKESIKIHIYLGGPAGTGKIFKSVTASKSSETAVARACGSTGTNYRFKLPFTQSEIYKHRGKSIYIHGISIANTANLTINNSGKYFIPNHPTSSVKGYLDRISKQSGDYYVSGWACQSYDNNSIGVHLYAGNYDGGKKFIASGQASLSSETAVATACKTTGKAHRFNIKLDKKRVFEHMGQPIYAYGLSTLSTGNKSITNSGTFKLPSTLPLSFIDSAHSSTADFTVRNGHTVTIDSNATVGVIKLEGKMVCTGNGKHTVKTEGILVRGAGSELSCGSSSAPYTGNVTFDIVNNEELISGNGVRKGIMAMAGGKISLFGKSGKQGVAKLSVNGNAGNSSITLNKAVNWSVGDFIVIAASGFDPHHAEKFKIKSISSDKRKITLVGNLAHNHWGKTERHSNGKGKSWTLDERAEVINLTRNIKITTSTNDDIENKLGAHVMIMSGSKGYIDNVEFENVGQMGEMGRYPFHWHQMGNASGQFIKNSSIHNSFNRCVTIHGTNNAQVTGNSCYDHFGHGFFLEDGNEVNNTITHNIGILSKRLKSNDDKQRALLISESTELQIGRWAAPATYWISNPNNTVSHNIAAGSEGAGFWMSFHKGLNCNTNGCEVDGNGNIKPLTTNTLAFNNNVAHSSIVGITHDGAPDGALINNSNNSQDRKITSAYYNPSNYPTFSNLVAYKNSDAGLYYRGSRAVYNNAILADNGRSAFFAYDQELINSLVVGFSENHNSDELNYHWNGGEDGKTNTKERYQYRKNFSGVLVYDGPFFLKNVHFANFSGDNINSPTGINVTPAAIKLMGGAARYVNRTQELTFANEDGSIPLRKVDMDDKSSLALNWGDSYSGAIFDLDGTLSGSPRRTILANQEINDDISCHEGKASEGHFKTSICNYQIGHVRFSKGTKTKFDFDVFRLTSGGTLVGTSQSGTSNHYSKFPVILGSDYHYRVKKITANNIDLIIFSSNRAGEVSPLISIENLPNSCVIKDKNNNTLPKAASVEQLKQGNTRGYRHNGNHLYFKVSSVDENGNMRSEAPKARTTYKLSCG